MGAIVRIFGRHFNRYIKSENGAVLPIAAFAFPLIFGMAGLGVDASSWMMQKRNLQTAADAAAIAGGWELSNGGSPEDVEYAALKEAEMNGYNPENEGAQLHITISESDNGNPTVQVDIEQAVDVWFSSMFMDAETIQAGTTATSEIEGVDGGFCILSLNEEDSGSVTTSGSVTIEAPGCGIAVNSEADDALTLNGNVEIDIGRVKIAGGYDIIGGSADFSYSSMNTNASKTADPYEDLEIPEFNGCSNNEMRRPTRITGGGSHTLSPGVFCGGITISGNNDIELEPGVYILDGGDFDVSGGGSITGEGVTIILTNSGGDSYGSYGNMDLTGNKEVYLEAPTEGEEWEGVVVFQDRNAPADRSSNRITGTTGVEIRGAAYTPTRPFEFGGDGQVASSNTSPCSRIIADSVVLHGNAAVGNNCDGTGMRPIGSPFVKLVE